MKFGIRECCDVVFRAKAKQKVGNKWFFKDEDMKLHGKWESFEFIAANFH